LETAQPDCHDLVGRVALVTGAARGQGRQIASRLHAAGASIIAGDLLADQLNGLVSELGDRCVVGPLDVRAAASWSKLVDQGVSAFGRLDILVNNAGVLRRAPIEEETEDGFADTWRVNCLGPLLGIKTALPALRRSGHGAIVNTSSVAGVTAWSMHAAYVSSKWAVRGLTRVAALELAADGIRVNAVIPGPIATPMLVDDEDPGVFERLSRLPLGRIGQPEDVAEAVLFLASDRSAFLTGSEITVDGGQLAGSIFAGPARRQESMPSGREP
jgi:NAD(P)-dependent dehydrogenase (short-subunit alcohol dehydrogenase family)